MGGGGWIFIQIVGIWGIFPKTMENDRHAPRDFCIQFHIALSLAYDNHCAITSGNGSF